MFIMKEYSKIFKCNYFRSSGDIYCIIMLQYILFWVIQSKRKHNVNAILSCPISANCCAYHLLNYIRHDWTWEVFFFIFRMNAASQRNSKTWERKSMPNHLDVIINWCLVKLESDLELLNWIVLLFGKVRVHLVEYILSFQSNEMR